MSGLVLGPAGEQRFEPNLPVQAYRSFTVAAPEETHWRPASCAEVDCRHYLQGWWSTVDERTQLGQGQAYYIRHDSGRRFVESRSVDGQLTLFWFEPGQVCFSAGSHRTAIGRPALWVSRNGDWRANLGDMRLHTRPEFWIEEWDETADRLARVKQRG